MAAPGGCSPLGFTHKANSAAGHAFQRSFWADGGEGEAHQIRDSCLPPGRLTSPLGRLIRVRPGSGWPWTSPVPSWQTLLEVGWACLLSAPPRRSLGLHKLEIQGPPAPRRQREAEPGEGEKLSSRPLGSCSGRGASLNPREEPHVGTKGRQVALAAAAGRTGW